MVDMQSVMESIAKHRKVVAEIGKTNKVVIFDALAAEGITRVGVSFDGEGDSGQIEAIAAYKGEESVPLPAGTLCLQSADWSGKEIRSVDLPFERAVETLCYDFLEIDHGGWEKMTAHSGNSSST
jgi:hypothetical protein